MYSVRSFGAFSAIVSLFFTFGAVASEPMHTGAEIVPPAGFIGFCARHLADCAGAAAAPAPVVLTDAKEQELETVQGEINRAIEPEEDPRHVWDYPVDGRGDCNKYALAKRRALIELGWPREALLLTTAVTEHGEGHLVLIARTSEGDLVLDNRFPTVIDWSRLPYRWVGRQSERRPTIWLSLAG